MSRSIMETLSLAQLLAIAAGAIEGLMTNGDPKPAVDLKDYASI